MVIYFNLFSADSEVNLVPTDKAFRHGDIENILETLVKSTGVATGGGILGIAQSVISSVSGGAKFTKGDIKKVYFVSARFGSGASD